MEDCWHWSKEVITGTKSRGRKVSMWKCEWGHLFWLAGVALSARWELQPHATSRVRGGEEGTGLRTKVSHRANWQNLDLQESVPAGLSTGFLQQVAFAASATAVLVHVCGILRPDCSSPKIPHPNALGEIPWANKSPSHTDTLLHSGVKHGMRTAYWR